MNSINIVLEKVTNNVFYNKMLFLKYFNSLDYCDDNSDSLLHLVIKGHGSYNNKMYAIMTLLKNGINPSVKDKDGNTFIHLVIKLKYDMNFIIDILLLSIQHGFDVNILNNQGNTILHEAIISSNKKSFDNLLKLAIWLRNRGFKIKTSNEEKISTFIDKMENLTKRQKEQLKMQIDTEWRYNKMNNNNDKENKRNNPYNTMNKQQSFNISKYGRILNEKEFLSPPAFGRDKEIYDIIIALAQDKKLPLLVGASGVGKTSIVDHIAYMIKNDMVPNFLKNKKIYEVTPFSIVAGTSFRGELEKNMKEILDYCLENNVILFIDEFHTIYGSGATRDSDTDIAAILKNYIDRYKLTIIGATTDIEYNKYIANDPLKRRFEVIKVDEPSYEVLYDIIINTFEQVAINKEVSLNKIFIDNIDTIINILLELTKDKNRVYNDKISNPDLIMGIIDKTFAYAIVDDSSELKIEHLINSIDSCERIYPSSKEIAIRKLNNLVNQKKLVRTKGIVINFSDYKKKY